MPKNLSWIPFALLLAAPATGQSPPAADVTCRVFTVDDVTSAGTAAGGRAKQLTVANTHAAEIEAWLEERGATGQLLPAYRTSLFTFSTHYEVVCVR